MNASAASAADTPLLRRAPAPSAARRPAGARARWGASRLVAFAALALLAGVRFAALLANPPVLRVLGVVAAATAGAAALSCTRALPRRRGVATAMRIAIVALMTYAALRACGAPPRMLWPWQWTQLARALGHGLDALNGLWPYDGGFAQARVAVMFALPATIVPAGALAFWPDGGRARGRRTLALGMLLGLYLTAATNEPRVGWQVQGILLLGLLCLWGWAWRPRAIDGWRASAWMLVAAALALTGASVVNSSEPLLGYRDWNPFGPAFAATNFSWNQVYGPLPWPKSNEPMVSVTSPSRELWRATTLDRFDGVRFLRSDAQPANAPGPANVELDRRWVTHATFTVRGLSISQLLSPGEVIDASITGAAVPRLGAVAPDGTIDVLGASPPSGDRYTVTAYAPRPSAAEMRAAPPTLPASYLPYIEFGLPPSGTAAATTVSGASAAGVARIEVSPYAGVYALARRLASGTSSSYDVVARVEAFLRHGFTYDEHPPRSAYPLVSFLLRERIGYCQQFSGAMTLMLRMDDIPARVAAGFLAGTRDASTGSYEVSARDAHAWVEVYFAGIGWVPFDPTPAAPRTRSSGTSSAQLAGAGAAALRHRADPSRPRSGRHARLANGRPAASLDAGSTLAIGLTSALVLLLGAVWWAGTITIARALAGDAQYAVRELSRALPRVGVPLGPDTTLTELEARLQHSHGPGASRYVRLLRARRYAPRADPTLPTARDRRLLRRALYAHRGPLGRIRVLLALPPGLLAAHRRGRARAR